MNEQDGRETKERFRQLFEASGRSMPPEVEARWNHFIALQDRNRRQTKIVKFAVAAVIILCVAAMTIIILRSIWP